MKRIAGYSLLTALLAGLLWTVAPAQVTNPLTRAVLQARAWTFTALQTFAGGLKLGATSNAVTPAGIKLDADTGDIETYKNGTLSTRDRGTSWQPPFCPPDPNDMGVGFCYDAATGKMKVRDAAGVRDL